MKPLNLVVIAGEGLQGEYFIRQLGRHFPLSAVFIEAPHYPPPTINNTEDRADWDWFFLQRNNYEQIVFGAGESFTAETQTPVLKIPHGGLENEDIQRQILNLSSDLIVIFNTSVLSENFIDSFEGNIINLHVGLADKYRGSSCNFWPIHNRDLEGLGATVHRVNAEIDAGDYYARESIQLEASDSLQSLIAKPLIKGVGIMVQTIRAWQSGKTIATPLGARGRLYFKKDFQPAAIRKVREMEDTGELQNMILERLKE